MKISEIIYRDEYILSEVDEDTVLNGLTTDPRNIKTGDVLLIPNSLKFVNIGELTTTPIAVICDTNAILPDNFPAIRVTNPRLAMANAYHRFSGLKLDKTRLIGVTGTNGKTSTANFIKTILSSLGYKVGFVGTGTIEIDGKVISAPHYSMTTPDPSLLYPALRQMELSECDAIVMEVSSHALALEKVAPLRFDYGVFTNLSSEHTDFHGNKEDYFLAKRKLFSLCDCAVINIDDEYGRRMLGTCGSRKISAGILWRGDVWATNIENKGFGGIGYMYHRKDFSFRVSLQTAGIYNAYNSMLAATVCIDMGCKPCEVKRILENIQRIPGRYEIINDEITVIIDYAHTDSAFREIMKELSSVKGEADLCVVFGCGGDRDKEKRPKMARISERYSNRIIVTTDNSRNEDPKNIISDIIRGFESGHYEVIEDRERAIRSAILSAKASDVVAIIGKGCERYNIDKNGYHDFDEREIIMKALEERRKQRCV